MYNIPSGRRKTKPSGKKLNLVPILDSVFILIFFLLLSASFLKIYEINSNVPILSSAPPPPLKKPPLGLTISMSEKSIVFRVGESPQKTIKSYNYNEDESSFPYEEIHSFLIDLKKKNPNEKTAILEPSENVTYLQIVKLMDAVRMLKKTDDEIWTKDKDGIDLRVEVLFDDLIFGNITS